jgi:DNA polymerase III epsilon subunit-like protein
LTKWINHEVTSIHCIDSIGFVAICDGRQYHSQPGAGNFQAGDLRFHLSSLSNNKMHTPLICELAAELKKPITIIDLETTGFVKPGVVEIACFKAKPDGKISYKSTLVDPERPIDPRASDVHGIRKHDVIGHKPLSAHLDFIARCYAEGVMSGFNVIGYDLRVLRENAAHYRYPALGPAQALDVRDLWKSISDTSKGKLVDIAQHYCVEVKDAHRALGDTLMTAHVLEAMLREHGIPFAIQQIKHV